MKNKDDITICAYGTAALMEQVNNLEKEWEGVHSADNDIEYVHRMRVATRRFRSVFDIFQNCLPKKKRITWENEVVRLTKALSKARDLDVHISMLDEFSHTLPEPQHHAGISRFQLRLRQERDQIQPKIKNDLDRIEKKGILKEIENTLKEKLPTESLPPARYSLKLYQLAFKSINRCMNKLLSYDGRIQNPKNVEDLHEMRLEAKNLRYTIEIFRDLYADRLEYQLSVIEDIQSQLGEIHDDDNWILDIKKFGKAERKRTTTYFGHEGPFNLLKPGLDYLQQSRETNRAKQYNDFIQKWEQWKAENLWGSLYQATKLPTIIYQPEAEVVEESAAEQASVKKTRETNVEEKPTAETESNPTLEKLPAEQGSTSGDHAAGAAETAGDL